MTDSIFAPPQVDRRPDWTNRPLRTILKARSERSRPDLPLLTVARERGVFVRTAEDGNHNAIPEDLSNYKVARQGDLVINKMKAWQGSLGLAPVDGIVSPAYFVFEADFAVAKFGEYLLRSKPYVARFAAASDGVRVGQWDLNIPRMRSIVVPLPPVEEQTAIVKYLAHANARINSVIRGKQLLARLLAEQALAEDDFDLHQTPESAQPIPLKYVMREIDERSPAGLERHLSMSQRVGLVPAEEVERTLMAESMANGRLCRKGDIVLNRLKAHLGVFSVAPMDGVVSPDYTILRVTRDVDPNYLCAKLRSRSVRPELRRRTKGIVEGFWRLYAPDLLSMEVVLPARSLQARVVSRINERNAATNQLLARIDREISLLEELRTRLVADAVTGQIDVRVLAAALPDPDAEPVAIDVTDHPDGLEVDGPLEMSEV